MQFDDENKQEGGDLENIEEMLDDLGIGEEVVNFEASKKDSTVFLIDCSEEIMKPFIGEDKSQLELIFEGYYNFLQRKIIANANDKVGLILYNVKNTRNSISHSNIFKVHTLETEVDAKRIKESNLLYKQFQLRFGGVSEERVSLSYALWEYGSEISNLKSTDYYLRLFLFTAEDNPHPINDQNRPTSIKRARELAAKEVQIQLFPLRKSRKCQFDITKFFQEIITFDPDQINSTQLDSSSKILDLQERLRQKEFKKRTLNRLTMKIGKDVEAGEEKPMSIGLKIYSLFTKAKKPPAKKVEAKSNKVLQRITKKMNSKGETLFDGVVGTYYPLGGEKIKITKEDMNKIKNFEKPGVTLIGFKPKNLIKPYHNLRTSYFVYPDEEHISGSSQFCDALITQLCKQNLVGIVKIVPRNNQELRFAALFPQEEKYDEEDHFQTPPGFHMIILPFAEDIVNFTGDKTTSTPQEISSQLIQVTKLLINNLTIHDFDFRDFQNPSLQKFYSHLQAHALNETEVMERPDLLEPDQEGFQNFKDIIDLVKETVGLEVEGHNFFAKGENYENGETPIGQKPSKKSKARKEQAKKQLVKEQSVKAHSEIEIKEEEKNVEIILNIESLITNDRMESLKVTDLRQYLKINGLDPKGKKDQLIDRIMTFMAQKNSIMI